MKEITIRYYTNSRGIYNTPHFAAWALAGRLRTYGLHNLRYGFLPPKVVGISLYPDKPDQPPLADPEQFTVDMFKADGMFHETPLNHYIKLKPAGQKDDILINAGYLLNHFIISDSLGYAEYKRLISLEKDQPTKADTAAAGDSKFQAAGSAKQG